MASIENQRNATDEQLRAALAEQDDGGIIAQQCVQKGALHAVEFLLAEPGNTYKNAKRMQESLTHFSGVIDEECRRRGLPVIELKPEFDD